MIDDMQAIADPVRESRRFSGGKFVMKRLLIVLALVLLTGLVLAGTALAAPPGPNRGLGMWLSGRGPGAGIGGMMNGMMGGMMGRGNAGGSMMAGSMMGGGSMMADLQKLLGLSRQEIHDQMVAGKSLVDMAAAKGVGKDQLIKALLEGRRAAFDQAVAGGRMTQEQATAMLEYMARNIEAMVTAQGLRGMMLAPGGGAAGAGGGAGGATPGSGAHWGNCPMHSGQPGAAPAETGGAGGPQNEWPQA